jgi:nicotinate-nucleotide adenylyltransferase
MSFLKAPGPVADGLKIGILGGSFNPAHGGHVYLAETALTRLKLDYVWWLVSPGNPLKDPVDMAPFRERLASARFVARHPRFVVTGLERHLGTVFTADTLEILARRFPRVRFVWLMGSDNLDQFDRWWRWRDIVKTVPVAVAIRPGSALAPLKAKAMQAYARARTERLKRPPAIVIIDGRRNEENATAIRALGKHYRRMIA